MNRTFKVVFNKARGALMVANEATSSVQKKGSKAVVAAAVALISGASMADAIDNTHVTSDNVWNDAEIVFAAPKDSYALLVDGASLTIKNGSEGSIVFQSKTTASGNTDDTAGTAYNAARVEKGGHLVIDTGTLTVGQKDGEQKGGDRGFRVIGAGSTLTIYADKIISSTGDEFVHVREGDENTIANIGSAERRIKHFYGKTGWGKDDYGVGILQANEGGTINFWAEEAEFDGSANPEGGVFSSGSNGTVNVNTYDLSIKGNLCGTYGLQTGEKFKTDKLNLNVTTKALDLDGSIRAGSSDSGYSKNDRTAYVNLKAESGTIDGDIVAYKRGNISVEGTGVNSLTITGHVQAEYIDGDTEASATSTSGGSISLKNVTITSSDENAAVSAAEKGTVNFLGNVTVNGDLAGAGSMNASGSLTLNGNLTGLTGTLNVASDGTLKVDSTKFFTKEGEDANWTVANVNKVTGSGVIDFMDVTGSYTLDQLKNTQGQFGDSLQIVFSNAELKLEGGEDLTAKGIEGYVLGTVVGDATAGTFSVSKNTTLAGVDFGAAEQASVSADAGKTLTLVGNDSGDVFEFGEDTPITNVTATNVQLGTDAASKGQVNVETLTVDGTFNVVGNYTANEISVGSAAQTSVAGALDVKTLSGEGTMNVADGGVLTAGQINANVTLTTNGMLVLGDVPVQDEPVVAHLAREVVSGQVNRIVKIGVEGEETGENILTTNRAAGEALKAAIADGQYGEGTESYNGIYVDKAISVGTNGQVVVGTFENNTRTENIAIGKDVVTVIDMNAFSSGGVVFDASSVVFNNEGKAVLTNLYSEKTLKLINGTDKVEGNTSQVFKDSSTNVFLTASAVQNAEEGGTDLVVKANENVTTDAGLKGALGGLLAEGANLDNQKVLAAIGDKNSGFVNEDGNALTAAGVQATKEYLTAPVTAGTYNVAYDAANVISDKLIQRNLEVKNGLGVWADVFYASNETDTLYGASGYSADIYGGMLGVDMAFGEGARVGAALSIGTGDADSEGSVFKYSSDADFWGLSLYAGKDVGGLTFTADMSYLWLDNDISGSVNGASASESLDSTVFTIGARADWAAYAGDVMQVVPHVGIRWANIDVDDYRGMSMDSMNVIEMPIGVTVKGNFETASGWTVTPAFDFTVAPQIGDTEVETIVGDVDVIDNVYNATIGVSAGNDTMRFGLDYKYGFGNEGRSNNTFNLKASYLF